MLVLLLGLLWGIPYALTKMTLLSIPPLTAAAARVLLAALVLWLAAVPALRGFSWSTAVIVRMGIMGLLVGVIPYGLVTYGQQSVGSGLASILNSSTPLFVCLMAMARSEQQGLNRILGAVIGIGGVAVVSGVSHLQGLGEEVTGQVAIIAATVSSAAGVIYGRHLAKWPAEVAAAGMLTAAAAVLLPVCLVVERPWLIQPSFPSMAALAANAVVATACGFMLYFRLIRRIGSVGTASASYVKPAIGAVIGCTLLGEPLTWTLAIGLAAVLAGVALINHKPQRPSAARAIG